MVRAVTVLAVLAAALAACKAQPPKGSEAAASSAPPAASSAAAAQPPPPAQPTHNWAYKQGDEYAYVSAAQDPAAGQAATLVRFLGVQDGVYTIVETEGGAVVGASCAKPCTTVRIRGKGLDQTLELNPGSVVYAALSDAMNGQLDVYKVPGPKPASAPTAPPQ